MTVIEDLSIRKIIDSRGNPTVEVDVFTVNGFGSAAAPSGASVGTHEVSSFPKNGVDTAISFFKKSVIPKLVGKDASEQRDIDATLHEIDGTENFSKIGGNVAVAVSIAVAKAAANTFYLPLYQYIGGVFASKIPKPLGNVLGGGKHAIGGPDIQEFLVTTFAPINEAVFGNAEVHKKVKEELKHGFPGAAIGRGDEGAWVAHLGNEEALNIVSYSCKSVSDRTGLEIRPSLDFAASEFYKDGKYRYKDKMLDTEGQINFVAELVDKHGLYLVEDPLNENDFDGFAKLTELIGDRCIVVGDDLFVTNKKRLEKGIKMGACNSILIKPNQIGTLTETFETVSLAHSNGYVPVMSHRSGETADDAIAHLAVGLGCPIIKTGVVGGERTAKLNELIRIGEENG